MPKGAPSDRAWQFMPFSALRGYEEYLHEQEDETVRLTSEIRIPEPGELDDECDIADICNGTDEYNMGDEADEYETADS